MAPSPTCEVKVGAAAYVAAAGGVDMTPSATIIIRLVDQSRVDSWLIECVTTDDTSDADVVTASLAIDTTNRTATFTAPSDEGKAYRFRSRVNGGVSLDGTVQSTYETTFCLYTTVDDRRVLAADESTEGDETFGWIVWINDMIRNFSSAGGSVAAAGSQGQIQINNGGVLGAGAGYLDANGTLRLGEGAPSGITIFTSGNIPSGIHKFFANNPSGTCIVGAYCGASGTAQAFSLLEALNYGGGAAATTGIRLFAFPTAVTPCSVNFVGPSTAQLVLSWTDGANNLTFGTAARVFRSGAFVIGDATHNDTSTEAQAGLTGALLSLAPISGGTLTSTANQAIVYNSAGEIVVQGHGNVKFVSGTTTVGYFDAATGGNFPLRTGSGATTSFTIFGSTTPSSSHVFYGRAASCFATLNATGTINRAAIEILNSSAGDTDAATGVSLQAAGTAHSISQFQGNGAIEAVVGSTGCLVFSKVLPSGSSRGTLGRWFATGAICIGDATQNDTSSEAQAGITGPLINLGHVSSGSFTSTSNQAAVANFAGVNTLQGHAGVAAIVNTTTVASINSSQISLGLPISGYATGSNPFRMKSAAITKSDATDHTLTAAQYECPIIKVSGTPGGNFNILGPNTADSVFYIINNTANTLTIKKSGGTGFTIAANKAARAWHNGTDYERLTTDSSPT